MEQEKSKKVLIGVLIAIIVLLLCAVCYLLFGRDKLKCNTDDNSSTTTTTMTKQNSLLGYDFEKTDKIASCVDAENDTYNYDCIDVFKEGVILEYPVIEEKTEVIKNINKKIFSNVKKNIESIENYPNVITNIKDAECITLKINNSNKMISFEHITIGKYLVKASNNYLSIINIDDMLSNCASGGYFLKDVIVYDINKDKIVTQDELKNTISNSLLNQLKDFYYEDDIYLFYNKNGNLSSIGFEKDSNDLLQIYELVNNKWNLSAEGKYIWE